MNTAGKLTAFAAVVAVGFGAAAAVGSAVGPIDVGSDNATHDAHGGSGPVEAAQQPRGLAIAEGGYRLALDDTVVPGDEATTFGFVIVDGDGEPVTAFDELHERPLHLIVLSRNMVDYLHLHPTLDPTGHWTVDVPALDPGSYRVFADFQPAGGANLTLGTDITVPGAIAAAELPKASNVATVDDYVVTMNGTPASGDSELSFTVARDGQTVRTDPYLGAAGHLVAIRGGDLAYLHVHPNEDESTPSVTFTAEFPTAGMYRLFFDFSVNGTVRTASFTVDIPDTGHDADVDIHEEGH